MTTGHVFIATSLDGFIAREDHTLDFRKRKKPPRLLRLYRDVLKESDIEERQGHRATAPIRTIIDCVTEGTLADGFIVQAVQ